jgi:hypothetical protein
LPYPATNDGAWHQTGAQVLVVLWAYPCRSMGRNLLRQGVQVAQNIINVLLEEMQRKVENHSYHETNDGKQH